jgi:hypothetical protein
MPLATELNTGRRVVLAEADRGNNYRVLSVYTAGLEAEFRRRGWDVSVARAREPDFLATLLRHAADPEAVALLGHFFYDLQVTAQNHFNGSRIGDVFRGRLCAMVADHPFTWFMKQRMQNADPRVVYCPAEPGFIAAASFINPQLKRFYPLALPVLYAAEEQAVRPSRRPIDVLVALTLRDVGGREQYLAELTSSGGHRRLAEALFARLSSDRVSYPFDVFRELMQREVGIEAAQLVADRQALRQWLDVLSKVDLIVRNERRIEMMRDLLRDTAGLRVHLVGQLPTDLPLPPDATLEGPLAADELGRRMAQSKWVVHCHPTYPRAMHERVLTAMATGCGVISDFAPGLDDTFEQGAEWLHARPGMSLRDVVAEIDADRLDEIGAAAVHAVQGRFGMTQHVDSLLTAVESLGGRQGART